MVVDRNGAIVYGNPAYTGIFGVSVGKVVNRRPVDIEPDSRVLTVLRTGKPIVDDPAFVISAGVDIVADITPIFEQRQLAGAVAIFRDRTEISSCRKN